MPSSRRYLANAVRIIVHESAGTRSVRDDVRFIMTVSEDWHVDLRGNSDAAEWLVDNDLAAHHRVGPDAADVELFLSERGKHVFGHHMIGLMNDWQRLPDDLEDVDPTRLCARRIRDALVALSIEHEMREHHGGECADTRIGMIAFLAHSLGLSYENMPSVAIDMAEYELIHRLKHHHGNGGRSHAEDH